MTKDNIKTKDEVLDFLKNSTVLYELYNYDQIRYLSTYKMGLFLTTYLYNICKQLEIDIPEEYREDLTYSASYWLNQNAKTDPIWKEIGEKTFRVLNCID